QDERVVELFSPQGRALREQARHIPSCVVNAT
ncbi:MarR family transcriptional regulator, partial [Halomonas sp. SUBG004]